MTYKKRYDGRNFDQMREIEAKAGVIDRATGSGYFRIGKTIAYAAVYGPKELHPKFMQNPEKGLLRCHYNMMPFSGQGNRVRPGPNRRSKEIGLVTQKALLPTVNLENYPKAVVDVFIEFPQTDAGSRCAGICAASIALADAGIEMKDLVASVSVGRVDDKIVVDLDYEEEAHEQGGTADMPVAIIPSTGEFTLLQMDGELDPKQVKEALSMAKKACEEIKQAQIKALKDRFEVKK
ncbi:exosome complex exonuclease Rrp41 [Candidatus Woesearchaeota archaeon]|nr:exosome complex exonuclease Rrp41 [Candidatus Woesearchaeota archaeon]